jgi:hypothetical protein
MARMLRGVLCRAILAGAVCALAAPVGAQAAGSRILHALYEWHPNGATAGPQLVLENKLDLTGKFGVQCGKTWIFAYFGGGGEHDPFSLDATTGALSGSGDFPTGTVGMGSTYRSSEINYYDFKSAGPLAMTLSGQATQAAAVGTLSLKLYAVTKPRGHGAHKAKPKKVLSASCAIPFDAPNFYAEAPAAPEPPPPAESGEAGEP